MALIITVCIVLSNTGFTDVDVIPGAVSAGAVSANSVYESATVAGVFKVAADDVINLLNMI